MLPHMPGLPPNSAQFRPTTNVEPSPTRGWTPAINANCKASGATATAVANPAFTFAANEWSSVCGSLLNNNPDNSSTLVLVKRSARLVVRFCHFRYWRKYFLLVAGLVSALGRRRLAVAAARRRSNLHRILAPVLDDCKLLWLQVLCAAEMASMTELFPPPARLALAV